jgi:hypothetical protein
VETKTPEAKNDEADEMTLKTADKSKGCCLKLNFRELKVLCSFVFVERKYRFLNANRLLNSIR